MQDALTEPVVAEPGDVTPEAATAPTRAPWRPPAPEPVVRLTTLERLRDGQAQLSDRLTGWIVAITLGVIAFVIRVVDLGRPATIMFDETYYAKDAWALLKFGYEVNWPSTANASIASGTVNVYDSTAEFVVHPQLGKWLIASGEAVFGMNAFGWRIAACVFGSLLIVATVRLARRVSRSTLIGGIAGVLLCADGLEFTMSRIALLDIFQAFFLVAAVGAVVADRDYFRWKLADKMTALGLAQLNGRYGPIVWLRPWRLVAGVLFGLAIGVKWNSMFVLAAMGVLSVIWDIGARRLAGADFRAALGLLIEGIPAFLRLVVVAGLVYVATWASWWATAGGWDRRWGLDHPESPWTKWLGPDIASFMFLHQEIYGFHTGDYINHATHPYAATPAGWLLMLRPIAIDYQGDIKPGVDGCTATDSCVRAVTGMGTPILWWMAAAALIVGLVWWIGGRDWRFGLPIVAALSTYLPWFNYDTRPLFFFYAITIVPFTATILAMCFGLLLGAPGSPGRWRGGVVVGVATALVWGDFAYIYPVLSGELIPYQSWLQRMWLRSWI